MSHQVSLARIGRPEVTIAAGAAVILAIQVAFVAALLGLGLGHELYGAITGDTPCLQGQTRALTPQGKVACMSPGSELPRGWVLTTPDR